jgi:energy-coupling factor transport system ATP-binding protein
MIEITGLKHVYPPHETVALDGVNLRLESGEYVAILGPNGSGKSTLARHLNALLLPSEGQVRVDGMDTREPRHLWEIRRRVGMVFQDPDRQMVTTVVEEEVAFGPENLGLPVEEIRSRLDWTFQALELEALRRAEPHLLSGGQKQRVAIAAVLAMQPQYLVMDEPTTMLDPVGRREVLDSLRKLHREQGLTVLYVTHQMEEALEAGRVVVMSRGKVAMQGTPAEVFSRVDELLELGLAVPPAGELAHRLRRRGLPLPPGILTEEDLADSLASLPR